MNRKELTEGSDLDESEECDSDEVKLTDDEITEEFNSMLKETSAVVDIDAVVFDESPWMFERDESDDSEEEEGLPEMELIFENEYIM
jgi:hypothetical protein